MTKSELARDQLKYWKLIDRAKKVNFPIPQHWMKYGSAPNNASEIIAVNMDAISDKIINLFERDDVFFSYLKRK